MRTKEQCSLLPVCVCIWGEGLLATTVTWEMMHCQQAIMAQKETHGKPVSARGGLLSLALPR